MTDKQIIIKDYFNILRDEYNRIYCIQNIGDPKSLIKAIREQNEYIQAKEQECEKLKKQVCGLRPELKFIIDKTCCKYNIEAKNYHEKIVEIINNLEKLKTALIEIKEIAEIEIECKTYEIENDCFNETRCKALNEHIDFTKQILQKISEVENE